jgi:hypothetical protein
MSPRIHNHITRPASLRSGRVCFGKIAGILMPACLAVLASLAKADELPPKPDLTLPGETQTVRIRDELKTQHPRVFINAEGVAAFRQKITQPGMSEPWQDMLAVATAHANTPPPAAIGPSPLGDAREIGSRLPWVAFA